MYKAFGRNFVIVFLYSIHEMRTRGSEEEESATGKVAFPGTGEERGRRVIAVRFGDRLAFGSPEKGNAAGGFPRSEGFFDS